MAKCIKIRFHHLLCIPLFEGKGYSADFSENMSRLKAHIENSSDEISFVCESDSACEKCPNKSEDGCVLDEDGEKIEDRDKYIARLLGEYTELRSAYKAALFSARAKIGEEEFNKICGRCRWCKAELCSFEKWKNSVDRLLNTSC